jgi:hypothetical protein
MSKVFLITGFNNWGKSYLIKNLFGRKRFLLNRLYPYRGYQFCVESVSNDDLGQLRYEQRMQARFAALRNMKTKPTHILTAFCPTKEPTNDSLSILANLYSNSQIHIIAIEYKWCLHAKLLSTQVSQHFANTNNVTVHFLSEKDPTRKLAALDKLLVGLI